MTIDEYNAYKLEELEEQTLNQQRLYSAWEINCNIFCEMIFMAAKDVSAPPRQNHTLTALKESIEDIKTAYNFIFGEDLEMICGYIGLSAARIRRGIKEKITAEQMKYIEEPLYRSARRHGVKLRNSGQGILNFGVQEI